MASPWQHRLAQALQPLLGAAVPPGTAVERLIGLRPHRLLALDPHCRSLRTTQGRPSPDTSPLPAGDDPAIIAACLFVSGCDASGYRRQEAVRATRGYPSATTLSLLLIRCADWVDAVRREAEAALRQALSLAPHRLFDQVELIVCLRRHHRFASSAWPRIVAPVLHAPEHAPARWKALHAGDGRQCVLIADAILATEPHRGEALIVSCLRSPDPMRARWALQRLADGHAASATGDAHAIALAHPNAGIALQAMRLQAGRDAPDLEALVLAKLTGHQRSLRDFAAHLAPRFGLDPMRVWRDAIDAPSHPGGRHALASLSERAQPGDFDRFERWSAHPVAETRRHALAGLANADIERAVPYLERALASASAKEVRLALGAGRRASRFLTRETLVEAYGASPTATCHRLIIEAIGTLWPWERLDALLDCAEARGASIDADLADAGLADALRCWRGASIGKLDPRHRASLHARIDHAARRFPGIDWDRIRDVLDEG